MTSKAKAKSLSTDFTGVSKPFQVSKGSFTQKLTFLACFSIFLMIYFLNVINSIDFNNCIIIYVLFIFFMVH